MPARNMLFLIVISAGCLAAWAVRDRDAADHRLREVLAAAERVRLEPIDRNALVDAAIAAVVGRLEDDCDTAVAGAGPASDEGTAFGGVGLELAIDEPSGEPQVTTASSGAAAWLAGIRGGHRIVAIDGEPTRGLPLSEVAQRLRGQPGEAVTLRIRSDSVDGPGPRGVGAEPGRHDSPRDVTLVRQVVLPETVFGDRRRADGSWSWHLEDAPGIALVRIAAFGERTAAEFDAAFATITASWPEPDRECRGLVLDLRGNPGGSLATAVAICDRLIDEGVIVATRRRRGTGTRVEVIRATRDATAGPRGTRLLGLPVTVLIDRRTAGVAEVVAACLQDHGRAAVIGGRSAGRATVQSPVPLQDGSTLRLTTAEYLRPAGFAAPFRSRLHRPDGASETDPWGVEPDPGLSLEPTGAALHRLGSWRRDRDTPAGGSTVLQVAATDMPVGGSFGAPPLLPCEVDAVLATAVAWITAHGDAPPAVPAAADASEAPANLRGEEEAPRDADDAIPSGP